METYVSLEAEIANMLHLPTTETWTPRTTNGNDTDWRYVDDVRLSYPFKGQGRMRVGEMIINAANALTAAHQEIHNRIYEHDLQRARERKSLTAKRVRLVKFWKINNHLNLHYAIEAFY